jgi:hypothetical protein
VGAIWTLVRPLCSLNGPSATDDVHPVIGHSHHPRPDKYFGREWPLSRKTNVPWVSEKCRVELLLRLGDSVAPPYRVHSAGPIAGNGPCQSIQSYESLWYAHAQILGSGINHLDCMVRRRIHVAPIILTASAIDILKIRVVVRHGHFL